jgi:VanZ family protein
VSRLIDHYRVVARALAWVGISAVIYLSVVPAVDRPVTGAGQWIEHFTAFALVAGAFAIGYSFSLARLLLLAVSFCGGVELLQIPLPTRHARASDFVIDLVGSCFAILFVFASEKLLGIEIRHARQR